MPRAKYCLWCGSALAKREIQEDPNEEPIERMACSSPNCSFVHYRNPTPVVAAIIEWSDREIILVNNALWPEDWFGLVTGFLEHFDTSPADAVVRECKEELNLDVEVVRLQGLYRFAPMNQLIIAYVVRPTRPNQDVRTNAELRAWKLSPLHRVKPWGRGTGDAVKDYLRDRLSGAGGAASSPSASPRSKL